MGWLTCVANRSSLTSSSEFLSAPSSVFADGGVQVRSLLRSHSQGERSRASLAPGLYHPSPSIFSPSWSDRQGAVDDGAITGLRMRRSSAVRRPTPCHFSSLSSLLVHSSLFFWPTHGQVCRAFAILFSFLSPPSGLHLRLTRLPPVPATFCAATQSKRLQPRAEFRARTHQNRTPLIT